MASVNSAYKLRYQTYFSSWCERTWRVQIYDRKWTDPNNIGAQLFNLGESGVEITYDTDGNDKSSPIVGSKCAIDFMFEDGIYDNNNWFGDLLGYNTASTYLPYEEGDIFVIVSVMSGWWTYSTIWYGEYLHDLDTLPDLGQPFPMRLTFTDGLGKLKNTDFDVRNVSDTADSYVTKGYQKFVYWISQCLMQTKHFKNTKLTDAFWDDATDKIAFNTTCRWYNANHKYAPSNVSSTSDVLWQTKGQMRWTRQTSQMGYVVNYASVYEVLKQICKSWGMRIMFWHGTYRIYQILQFAGTNTGTWTTPVDTYRYRYYADGSFRDIQASMGGKKYDRFHVQLANNTNAGSKTQKLHGGQYKFLPIIREVKGQIMHPMNMNIWPDWDFSVSGAAGIPNFSNGSYTWGDTTVDFKMTEGLHNSTEYKIRMELYVGYDMPNTAFWTQGWQEGVFFMKIMACSAYIGNPPGDLASVWLADLEYNQFNGTYTWKDSSNGGQWNTANGPHFYVSGGPYYAGTSVVPHVPILEFPGYRDEQTWYAIHMWPSGPGITNLSGNSETPDIFSTGGANKFTLFEPIDNTQVNPPSWSPSSVDFDDRLCQMTVVGADGTTDTASTITTNTSDINSTVVDVKELYWSDGPSYYSESALQINTASGWTLSNWNSKDWASRHQTQGLPSADSGHQFTGLMMSEMKRCQQVVLRKMSCTIANSNLSRSSSGYPNWVNPAGVTLDCDVTLAGVDKNTPYMFVRGSYNIIRSELQGDWIEATAGPVISTTNSFKGGPGSGAGTGGGTQQRLSFSGGGSRAITSPRLMMARITSSIVKDAAITTLNIEQITGDRVYTGFSMKSGDKVYLKSQGGLSYELTLTADVTAESTSISFNEITPDNLELTGTGSDNFNWYIVCNVLDMYEQTNRKTRGTIAGLEVTATTIDGAKHVGREYLSIRCDANAVDTETYYVFYGEDHNKSGRMNSVNADAPTQIGAQSSLKAAQFLCPNNCTLESGKIALSATAGASVKILLYKITPVDGSATKKDMTKMAEATISGSGNSTQKLQNFTLAAAASDLAMSAGDLIIPHAYCEGVEVESVNFRGQIAFTLIKE